MFARHLVILIGHSHDWSDENVLMLSDCYIEPCLCEDKKKGSQLFPFECCWLHSPPLTSNIGVSKGVLYLESKFDNTVLRTSAKHTLTDHPTPTFHHNSSRIYYKLIFKFSVALCLDLPASSVTFSMKFEGTMPLSPVMSWPW